MRMRPDLELETMEMMVERLGASNSVAELDEEDIWPWVEEQRLNGHIDGFIVPRAIHAGHRMKGRRHTLGLQRDQTENNRERFIPPPLHGFTLLVGRQGFPKASIKEMFDPSAELAYRLEATLLESLSPELQPIVGAYVEQRKISTFSKRPPKKATKPCSHRWSTPTRNAACTVAVHGLKCSLRPLTPRDRDGGL